MTALMLEKDATLELVKQAQAGDREAFDRLAEVYRAPLANAIASWSKLQLGPRVDAEELVADTFVRAHRTLARFEWQGDDAFLRWLCGIAKRALAEAAQEARRRELLDSRRRDIAAPGPTPSSALRREERFDRLQAALDQLTPDQREVVLLCRIEGLTSVEAAARMDRSPEAVRTLLARALRALKERFGDTESLHLPHRGLREPPRAGDGDREAADGN
jgi:RNA polymerase sigma-70 factor (ECF subfamily)